MAPHHTVLAALLVACASAQAEELGNIGPVYPIGEQHFLDMINQRLRNQERSGELKRLEQQARARGIDAVVHPKPLAGLQPGDTARTRYYDPTFILDRHIFDDKGHLLFAAGTRKNPLEVVSMSKHLLFFDGRDQRQVERARALIDHYHGRVKPILVGGSYLDLMKFWRIPVYYDQQGLLTKRFQITQVPAIVSQEGLRLRIDELAL
ncbi:MAG TPA: type-F conjugative transfer system protein TraW [Telluria sp.]|nr:type-F conjugative transfer system protein TraW [Telluria sp.]